MASEDTNNTTLMNRRPIVWKTTSAKKHSARQRSISAHDSDSVDSDGESAFQLRQANDEDSPTADDTMLETILANKRKRELKQVLRMQGKKISATPYKEATSSIMTTATSNRSTSLQKASGKSSSVGVLNDTFSSSKHSRKKEKQDDEFDETTALGRKHKKAMEEYIQKQMQSTNIDSKGQSQEASNGLTKLKIDHHEALYRELAAKIVTQGEDAAGNKQDVAFAATENKKEGDIGAGGTMLGGTGIAEVILPIDHRIAIIRETQKAVMEKMHSQKPGPSITVAEKKIEDKDVDDWTTLLPMNFESGPSKRRRLDEKQVEGCDLSSTVILNLIKPSTSSEFRYSASSVGDEVLPTDVQAVSASYAHNFQLHSSEWISRRKEERDQEIERQRLSQEVAEGPIGNRQRVGFAVLRGKEPGTAQRNIDDAAKNSTASLTSSWRDSNTRRSNDDRVWSSFVNYQKERGGKRR